MIQLETFLRPTQSELFGSLLAMYKGNAIFSKEHFILVRGDVPVMLVAHLDTVHEKPVREICATADGNILMSPQGIGGDDHCGVYALVKAHALATTKPWLLFCCDEEVGGVGADYFCLAHESGKLPAALDSLKFLVEIDRKGANDAVYYDCYNPAFEAYITSKGFQTAYGSFSDISLVAPELGVAAVNLSSGYYNAHTLHEFINRAQLEITIQRVVEIISDAASNDCPRYEYADIFWAEELVAVPDEYREVYEELLDLYTADELDYFRKLYGDHVLYDIYLDEYCSPRSDSDDDQDDE